MKPPVESALLRPREAAAYLAVSLSHIQRHLSDILPRVGVGGRTYRYRRVDLTRWVERRAREQEQEAEAGIIRGPGDVFSRRAEET